MNNRQFALLLAVVGLGYALIFRGASCQENQDHEVTIRAAHEAEACSGSAETPTAVGKAAVLETVTIDHRKIGYVLIHCPRCKGLNTLKISKHYCNRFVCGGSSNICNAYDGHCLKCDFPEPRGTRAYTEKHPGEAFWAHGKYTSAEAERIFSQPTEDLPAPFNGTIELGANGWWT